MRTDRIDFISAYCDRWCERCAFTARCFHFAANCAITMCGDVGEGLEPSVGRPPAAASDSQPVERLPWPEGFDNTEPSREDVERFRNAHDAHDARRGRTSIMQLTAAYARLASRWLQAEREAWGPSPDAVVREAMEVISWDHLLIQVKLHRALSGRAEPFGDEHPIQNDANGSAKLALICIERSEASWRVIAQATAGELPLMMADHLAQLRADVEAEFPDARRFIRPGFDEEQPAD